MGRTDCDDKTVMQRGLGFDDINPRPVAAVQQVFLGFRENRLSLLLGQAGT